MNPSFDPSQLPLRDIHLPGEIAWWPFAFGWWLLSAAVVTLAILGSIRYWRGRRHRAARRALNAIMAELNTGAEPVSCAQRASIVLRRFAMTAARGRPEIAGVAGARWNEYLEGRGLPYVAAERVSAEDAMALCRACLAWVDAQPLRA